MKKRLKVTLNAPLVLGFALACTVVTLICAAGAPVKMAFVTYAAPMSDPGMYLRLISHVLGHSGLAHLLANMAYILLLGPMLEEKYGWKRLLGVIVVTAVITGVIHNLLFPHAMLMGASGVVFAMILMTSFTDYREGEIPLTFILVALIYLGQQVWDGITVKDNISNLTHIIGGLVGAGAGYLLNKGKSKEYGRENI